MQKTFELYALRQPHHRRTWTLAAIFLILIFIVAGQLLAHLGLAIPGLRHLAPNQSWQEKSFQLFFGYGFAALICLAWVRFFEKRSAASLGFSAGGMLLYGRGLLLGAGLASVVIGIIYLLRGYQIEGGGISQNFSLSGLSAIIFLLIGYTVQGATEEIFMRGWLFRLLISRYGVTVGVVGNTLLFSLLHAGNISYSTELIIGLFNTALVGLMFSIYALKETTLWGVCACHSVWNWLLGVGFGLEVSGHKLATAPLLIDLKNADQASVWITGGAYGPEASIVTTLILALTTAYLMYRRAQFLEHQDDKSLTK